MQTFFKIDADFAEFYKSSADTMFEDDWVRACRLLMQLPSRSRFVKFIQQAPFEWEYSHEQSALMIQLLETIIHQAGGGKKNKAPQRKYPDFVEKARLDVEKTKQRKKDGTVSLTREQYKKKKKSTKYKSISADAAKELGLE